jgi:pimeloyl-ACP methyl ester carboxylesterase
MAPRQVVVLVHGIRDFALWQSAVRETLEEAGFIVEQVNYGRFNLLQFLAPVSFFRNAAIREVEHQIRIVRDRHKDAHISLIAHSFGTYVAAHVMSKGFDWKFDKVIFCGSVLPYRFPFEQLKGRFSDQIINEVGTRDIWPAIAESVTFGYGSAGTYGFRRPLVRDRWHNKAHHGYFLKSAFCRDFWIPYLRSATITPGARDPEPPSILIRIISVVKLKYIFLAAIVVFLLIPLWTLGHMPPPPPPKPDVLGEARLGLFCSKENVKNPFPQFFDYVTLNLSNCTSTPEEGSRSFQVLYPQEPGQPVQSVEIPGYTHCFQSDFVSKATIVEAAMNRFFDNAKNKVSCRMSASVTRVIKMGYITKFNDSKTVAFAQSYNLDGKDQFLINQVPFTDVAQSDQFQKVELGADHSFSDDKMVDQVRQFGFKGILKE